MRKKNGKALRGEEFDFYLMLMAMRARIASVTLSLKALRSITTAQRLMTL